MKGHFLKKIFLAEDDPDDRELFEEAIRALNKNYELVIFNDGEKLMNCLRQNSIPDIIFLDLNMPRKTGMECVGEIRKSSAFKDIPIIILTTSCTERDVMALKESGANLFIVKPNAHQVLIDTLKDVLNTDWTVPALNFLYEFP
jgi:CheY-like chemotaxis protein